ncbi:hypothetical protein L1276_001681 [Flavobacterium sp. HSC-32F16]|uniref:AAA family ATPase n=1 Tax=Flavobacterium sp. HSC-32F16 TaxID=2910964 RepID=UPI0020A43FFC|nr:AAA family ATPase [Flavobacterium sp. HSC-32F16]MCP2026537.1 hypothetical protein [Flavobacterium sp. HSC-32F16]
MDKDWFVLVEKYTVPGARDKFEKICATLFKELHPNENVRIVEVHQGDGGIDVFIGKIGVKPIHVIQCKFFPKEFAESQKQQIKSSFKSAIESKDYKLYNWTLCIVNTLNLNQNKWWIKWKDETSKTYNLSENFINLIDGDDLIDKLKTHNLYNSAFEREDSIKIQDLHNSIIQKTSIEDINTSIRKASLFLSKVKNYFEKDPKTHIPRKETEKIINWVKNDLEYPEKNILILEGEKGIGKSVILKDVYEELINENYIVLGIKADAYYAVSPIELENKLFINQDISFSKIIRIFKENKKNLIVIIDQLDALSQTLSSSREYIQTYNRIINELVDEKNVRVIISSRSYDLNYDAELSTYKTKEYANVKASFLDESEVISTLKLFNITCGSTKVIQLLRTPNHLEIFCKLPNKNKINLNTLSSLKDLYDELWNSLIINQENLKLTQLLYSIAVDMYKKQQIIVNKQLIAGLNKELRYLLSNQLLTLENSNIQFSHQTFYDYCFARQFVELNNDIKKYINENDQNLEIRSVIKMVFEYLREYDHQNYIISIKSILRSYKYRFHIKSLIISNIGVLENPTNEEKELVEKYIFNNEMYEDIFTSSVFSKKWVEYLIDRRIPENYLFIKSPFINKLYLIYKRQSVFNFVFFEKLNGEKIVEYKKNTIWSILRNNINHSPIKIITYLDKLPSFSDKNNFIERIIINIDNWSNPELLPFFQKYIHFNKESDNASFWFYQILAKVFQHHPIYAFHLVRPIFLDIFNGDLFYEDKFSHEKEELLKKFYIINPEDTFVFILKIYIEILENNKATPYKLINTPYFKCSKFHDEININSKGSNVIMEEFLVEHLLNKKQDISYIRNFINKHKESNSLYIIRVLILLLKDLYLDYKDETYNLITIIHKKNGLNTIDDLLQLSIRQLIGSSFNLFTDNEKIKIIEIILSIKSPYEMPYMYNDETGRKRVHFPGFGRKQYTFIRQISLEEIKKHSDLKTIYQELDRRFGEIDINKARDVSSFSSYGVGPPLAQTTYNNMDLISWKKSMLKFDDNYKEDHGSRGGKTEHSRAFNDIVKNNPEKFYLFIFELFRDKKVSIDYITSGIDGLIDAAFDPEKVKLLCKKLIKLELDKSSTMHAIWHSDYLIKYHLIDKEYINFLCHISLHHPNPEQPMNESDPSFDSLNTVRGAAIHRIIQCYEYKEFEDLIFDTIEKATYDPQISVRVAVIQNLAFLNHLDLERSFKIFNALTEKEDIHLLKNSFRASQYFDVKFHYQMYPYFNKIIKNPELHNNGNVIVLGWLNDKINDKKLYLRFINSSDEAKLCALKIAEANLFEEENKINNKSLEIITKFLNQKDKKFSSAYSTLILRKFKRHNFELFYSFLLKYTKSSLCIDEPMYLLELLLECAKDYPTKCLVLLSNMNFGSIPNMQNRGYYDKEPVRLILAIYSKLNVDTKKDKKNIKQIKKALDVFDSMLKHNHLRISANNAIELTL